VIIPTRNSARTIEKCISSIRTQTFKNIELIVADSSSTDSTPLISGTYGALVMDFPRDAERTEKKSQAASYSHGEYLIFVDSDHVLSPKVIEKCVEACEKGADAVIIPQRIVGGTGYWASCRKLEVELYDGDDHVESPGFFRRVVFFDAGMYDTDLIFGEENDLCVRVRKAGARIVRIGEIIYHHEGPLKTVIMKKLFYGRTFINYFRKNPGGAMSQFSFIRIGWLMNRRKLMNDPAHALGMVVLKFVQYTAAVIGLMLVAFERKK